MVDYKWRRYKVQPDHISIKTPSQSKCGYYNRKIDGEFHTDYARILDQDDIRTRRIAWWLAGFGKSDFEKFRKQSSEREMVKERPMIIITYWTLIYRS